MHFWVGEKYLKKILIFNSPYCTWGCCQTLWWSTHFKWWRSISEEGDIWERLNFCCRIRFFSPILMFRSLRSSCGVKTELFSWLCDVILIRRYFNDNWGSIFINLVRKAEISDCVVELLKHVGHCGFQVWNLRDSSIEQLNSCSLRSCWTMGTLFQAELQNLEYSRFQFSFSKILNLEYSRFSFLQAKLQNLEYSRF